MVIIQTSWLCLSELLSVKRWVSIRCHINDKLKSLSYITRWLFAPESTKFWIALKHENVASFPKILQSVAFTVFSLHLNTFNFISALLKYRSVFQLLATLSIIWKLSMIFWPIKSNWKAQKHSENSPHRCAGQTSSAIRSFVLHHEIWTTRNVCHSK